MIFSATLSKQFNKVIILSLQVLYRQLSISVTVVISAQVGQSIKPSASYNNFLCKHVNKSFPLGCNKLSPLILTLSSIKMQTNKTKHQREGVSDALPKELLTKKRKQSAKKIKANISPLDIRYSSLQFALQAI